MMLLTNELTMLYLFSFICRNVFIEIHHNLTVNTKIEKKQKKKSKVNCSSNAVIIFYCAKKTTI